MTAYRPGTGLIIVEGRLAQVSVIGVGLRYYDDGCLNLQGQLAARVKILRELRRPNLLNGVWSNLQRRLVGLF
jgi:hypothetical protein